ncbi:HD domain-containing protein [Vacuolonema iberomarrocanum]|uniref:HD domain-containing protein n=1 Tax=Vacuolonema iberomarrocanum TaxID=3454632 RepID=UPI0019F4AA00|nr:HD domain-containing protein [filamentous cyanobacterium LEGE 07170]
MPVSNPLPWDRLAPGSAQDSQFLQSLQFILELDKLKQVLRQTTLTDGSRRENSAEHSWHIALMAIALSDYAAEPVNVDHAVRLLLIHDVVEIDAGDTFCFDHQANQSKLEREVEAAERLFGLLPKAVGTTFRALWDEFEAGETPEARFAKAMDCLQPLLHNLATAGGTWKKHRITCDRVFQRMQPIKQATPALWGFVESQIVASVDTGILLPAPTDAIPKT